MDEEGGEEGGRRRDRRMLVVLAIVEVFGVVEIPGTWVGVVEIVEMGIYSLSCM